LVKNSFVHFRLLRFAIGKTGIELKINWFLFRYVFCFRETDRRHCWKRFAYYCCL